MQLLETLRARFTDTQESIRALTDEINGNEGAVATEEQAANLATLNEELEGLLPRIEQASGLMSRMRGAAELLSGAPGDLETTLTRARGVQPSRQWETWGDYARALAGGEVDDNSRTDIAHMIAAREQRAGVHVLRRAFVDVTTPDVPGLLPPQWLTDIVDFIGQARPFITAFDQRPLPNVGMAINYPAVTQRPQVGKQTTEKTDIPSRKTTVTSGVANVQTFGGGEDVSIQVLQRTDPAYLGLMLELYAEEMALAMNAAAVATAIAAIPTGNKLTISAAAGNDDWATKLAQGAALVFTAYGVPNTMVMGVNFWQLMAGLTDTDGRPLFPNVAPSNPLGSTAANTTAGDVRGLTYVVDPSMIPSNSAIMGDSRAFTSMVGGVQTLAADNPSKLGRDYAVYEFAAFACRRPDQLVQLQTGA